MSKVRKYMYAIAALALLALAIAPATHAEESYYAVYDAHYRGPSASIDGEVYVNITIYPDTGPSAGYDISSITYYSGDLGGVSPEYALNDVVWALTTYADFVAYDEYPQNGELSVNDETADGRVIEIHATYDPSTRLMQEATLLLKDENGSQIAELSLTLKDTNMKALFTETQTSQGENQATTAAGGEMVSHPTDGDWVSYRVSIDFKKGSEYARGTALIKVVFHDEGYGISYEIGSVKVESIDTNLFEAGDAENQIKGLAENIMYLIPPYLPPEQLPSNGVYENSSEYMGVSVRATYDTSTGIMKTLEFRIQNDEGGGEVRMEATDSSIPGIAVAGGLGAGMPGLGGLLPVIVGVVLAVVVGVAIAVVRAKKKPSTPQVPQAPPAPPPPPSA